MILWGATIDDEDETTLSWFASGEPGIKDGTSEMVLAMVQDLKPEPAQPYKDRLQKRSGG